MTDLQELKRDLERLRGELELRVHLASLEAKDEWRELEGKWQRFSSRAGIETSAESVGEALDLLGEELKNGYRRLKAGLKS